VAAVFDPIGSAPDMLGIVTLPIESAATEDGQSGINVGIGKYLNENISLELEHTPNPSQPWKGNLEIELTPSINLESSTGGQTGIESAKLK
jgi:translocation and assembly module TamB